MARVTGVITQDHHVKLPNSLFRGEFDGFAANQAIDVKRWIFSASLTVMAACSALM
jgi:hypothetical protein